MVPNAGSPMALVREFHHMAHEPVATEPTIPDRRRNKRYKHQLAEHLLDLADDVNHSEFVRRGGDSMMREKYLIAVATQLAHLTYLCYGEALTHGIDLDAVLIEVHASNMAKVRSGVRRSEEDGHIKEPPGWEPPDVRGALFGR